MTAFDLDDLDERLRALGVDLDDDTDDDGPYGCDRSPVGSVDEAGSAPVPVLCDEWPQRSPGSRSGDARNPLGSHGPALPPAVPVSRRDVWPAGAVAAVRSTSALAEHRPPTRGSRSLSSDPAWSASVLDPYVDLPAAVAPPGYLIDSRAVLRYADGSGWVPGQRRVTLSRLWRFDVVAAAVLVPELLVRCRPELEWCARVASPTGDCLWGAVSVAAYEVPLLDWQVVADHPIGVSAPELDPLRMLSSSDVASAAGLTRSAVPTYLSRGMLPEPQVRVANSPLWSAPIISRWLAARAGPGRPSQPG